MNTPKFSLMYDGHLLDVVLCDAGILGLPLFIGDVPSDDVLHHSIVTLYGGCFLFFSGNFLLFFPGKVIYGRFLPAHQNLH